MILDMVRLGKIADQLRPHFAGKSAGATKHNIMAAILIAGAGFSVRGACEAVPGSSNSARKLAKSLRPLLAQRDLSSLWKVRPAGVDERTRLAAAAICSAHVYN